MATEAHLPSGWSRERLGDLVESAGEMVRPGANDNQPYVALEHIAQGSPRLLGYSAASEATSAKTAFKTGDILYGKLRPNLRKSAEAPFDGVCSTDILALRAGARLDRRFLLYLTHWPEFQDFAVSTASGTKMPRTSWGLLRNFTVPLPPQPEQRKIAAILSSIDEVIERGEAVVRLLEILRLEMSREIFSGGGVDHRSRTGRSGISGASGSWSTVELGSITRRITDGVHQSVKTDPAGEIPFLFVSCVRDGRILWENAGRISRRTYDEVSRRFDPAASAVLYSVVGSYGNAAVVQGSLEFGFQRHMAMLVPDEARVSAEFLMHWLNGPSARSWADSVAVGNAQKTVTLGALRRCPVPLPALEEQKRIASLLSEIADRLSCEQEAVNGAREMKCALASALLSGEIRVAFDEAVA